MGNSKSVFMLMGALSIAGYANAGDGPQGSEDPSKVTIGVSLMKDGNMKGSPDYMPGGSFDYNGPLEFHIQGNANGEKTDYKIKLRLNAAKENMFGVFPADTFMEVEAYNSNDEQVPLSLLMAKVGFKAEEKKSSRQNGDPKEFIEGSIVQGFSFVKGSKLNNASNLTGAEFEFMKKLWGTLPLRVKTLFGILYTLGGDQRDSEMLLKSEAELDIKLASDLHLKPSVYVTGMDGQVNSGLKLTGTYDLNFGSTEKKRVVAR